MRWSVEELRCRRGARQVLAGVSFVVEAGEALILRGPNGAGKTTLLRCLAGLTPPIAGRIDLPEDAVAYGGHADGIKAQLTVRENLTFWASVFGGGAIDAALAAFALEPLGDRLAGQLSAGQRRRLSLARLLVTRRPIWLLDEPTVSLDAENTARFAAVVRGHVERGGSALIATHIDLGLPHARVLDITPFAQAGTVAGGGPSDPFAEAFE